LLSEISTPAPLPAINLSAGKTATQSSLSAWSRGATLEEDAAGALNGIIDGTHKFHTALEDNPWWQVDLGTCHNICEVRIFNRIDPAIMDRFRHFTISVSIDGAAWAEIAAKEDDSDVGGFAGAPYIWAGPGEAWGRYLRITLRGRNFLHLDQVQVFGR
jgi:hypothetical protein